MTSIEEFYRLSPEPAIKSERTLSSRSSIFVYINFSSVINFLILTANINDVIQVSYKMNQAVIENDKIYDESAGSSEGFIIIKSNFTVKGEEENLVNESETIKLKKTKKKKTGIVKVVVNLTEEPENKRHFTSKSFQIPNSSKHKNFVKISNDVLLNFSKNKIINKNLFSSSNEQTQSNASSKTSFAHLKRHTGDSMARNCKYLNSFSNRIPLKITSLNLFEIATANQLVSKISSEPISSKINNKYTNSVVLENCRNFNSRFMYNPGRSTNNTPSLLKEISIVDLNSLELPLTQSRIQSSSGSRNKFSNFNLNKNFIF